MRNSDIKSVTKKHFDAYAANWEKRLENHCFLTRLNTVKAMLKDPITTIVDLGSGTGDYSTLFGSSINYIGIDNSSGMVDKARALYPNRKFSLEDVENTSIPDNYADCVLAIGLFEYLENPAKLIDEIWRITKKNGQVIVTFQNKDNITKKVSLTAMPAYLVKKIISVFSKREKHGPLALKAYVKDRNIMHRKYAEKEVLELFARFIHTKTRFANFNIIRYFTGLPLRRLDECTSAIIASHDLDNVFSIYGSILLMSFKKI